jgi:hypothetical protein
MEKEKKNIISDDEALDVFLNNSSKKVKVATVFVPRTIVYPVKIERRPGEETTEIRTFVRMFEYCSQTQWERALELEARYPKLNKQYTEELKKRKIPVTAKEPVNPLKATAIGLR